jgi:hypothetical protein
VPSQIASDNGPRAHETNFANQSTRAFPWTLDSPSYWRESAQRAYSARYGEIDHDFCDSLIRSNE